MIILIKKMKRFSLKTLLYYAHVKDRYKESRNKKVFLPLKPLDAN